MMRKRAVNKRKSAPTSSLATSLATKQHKKNGIDGKLIPIPHHISIANGYVRYYFDEESKATVYQDHIRSASPSHNIIIVKVEDDDADTDGSYFRVSLSPEIFDKQFGDGAYRQLDEINDVFWHSDSATTDHAEKLVDQLDAALANQAAFLMGYDGFSAKLLIHIAVRRYSKASFLMFLDKLSAETCNQVALLKTAMNIVEDHHTTMLIVRCQSLEALMMFTDRLKPEILVSVMLSQVGFDKSCTLEYIAMIYNKQPGWLKILSAISQYPEEIRKISNNILHLKTLHLYDGGASEDIWSVITEYIIKQAPPVRKRKAEYDLPASMARIKDRRFVNKSDYLNQLIDQGWQFLRVQGRTVVLQDKKGKYQLAVKIQKHNELKRELGKEYNTTSYLSRRVKTLHLKSDLPVPVMVGTIHGVLEWLEPRLTIAAFNDFEKMVGSYDSHAAYVYKIDVKKCDYLTYLHDTSLSDSAFMVANEKAVHDLFTLLARGIIFPQLADLFHNSEHVDDREDKGRYMVLVNLLRDLHAGSGRLTGWKEAVDYPNVRGSGLADLGDRVSLKDYIADGSRVKSFYQETRRIYGDKASNYLLANIMAEYQYVLFLIAGRRGYGLTEIIKQSGLWSQELDMEISLLWCQLARQIVSNCALAVSILTHQCKDEVEAFLSSIVDVDRLARQMQYWMTEEYISDVNKGKIPEDIYGTKVPVTVIPGYFRPGTFNDKVGFSIDGIHADLGPVNGQEPIKEANKLFYWMVSSVFNVYHQVQFTLRDLRTITNEGDFEKSEALRKQSFSHLPATSYHAIQMTLCQERLVQAIPLTHEQRVELKKEEKTHKRSKAALTILSFWRKHKDGLHKQKISHMDIDESEKGKYLTIKKP